MHVIRVTTTDSKLLFTAESAAAGVRVVHKDAWRRSHRTTVVHGQSTQRHGAGSCRLWLDMGLLLPWYATQIWGAGGSCMKNFVLSAPQRAASAFTRRTVLGNFNSACNASFVQLILTLGDDNLRVDGFRLRALRKEGLPLFAGMPIPLEFTRAAVTPPRAVIVQQLFRVGNDYEAELLVMCSTALRRHREIEI